MKVARRERFVWELDQTPIDAAINTIRNEGPHEVAVTDTYGRTVKFQVDFPDLRLELFFS